jgi:hypothetical protein
VNRREAWVSRWKRRRATGDDQGVSLVEILVTTGIMSVVTLVAVTATIQIYSGTKQIEQNSVAGDQLDTSFTRLDRELRYATYMTKPGSPPANPSRVYMEFAIPPRARTDKDTTDPKPRCRQLLFDTARKVLTMTSWELGAAQGQPATLATEVLAEDGGVAPFQVILPGDPFAGGSSGAGVGTEFLANYLMVRIRFKVTVGEVTQRFDSTFTSQNIDEETDRDGYDDNPELIDLTLEQCKVGRP